MTGPDAWIDGDGSVVHSGLDGEHRWADVAALAADYWRDQRLTGAAKERAELAAGECVDALMAALSARWADVVQALVDAAASDGELAFVGAGVIEELVSQHRRAVATVHVSEGGMDPLTN